MTSEAMEKWLDAARLLGEPKKLNVPLDVLFSEAVQCSKFVKTYWEATDSRPGLSSAGPKLAPSIADDILSIRGGVQDAQVGFLMIVEPKVDTKTLIADGTRALNEITAVLEWHLDDGVEDDADIQLANIKDDHKDDTDSSSSLAQALHDYGTFAKPLQDELDGLGNFNGAIIDEALALADQLGEVSLTPQARSEQARVAKRQRDQLANLLQSRIRLVRAASRFVFRNHPQINREVTSAYDRRRRAAAKRAQQASSDSPV